MKAVAKLFVCELTNFLKRPIFYSFSKNYQLCMVQRLGNDKILSIYEKIENMGGLI